MRDHGRAPLGGRFTFICEIGFRNLRARKMAAAANTMMIINIATRMKRTVCEPSLEVPVLPFVELLRTAVAVVPGVRETVGVWSGEPALLSVLVGVAVAPFVVAFGFGVAVGSICPLEVGVAVGPGCCVAVGVGSVLVGVGLAACVGVGVGV